MSPILTLTPHLLRLAADVQEQILELQNDLNKLLGFPAQTLVVAVAPATETPKRRKVSAAGRARIAKAQQERWAGIKGTTTAPATKAPKKRKLSALGLANIRAGVAKRAGKKRAVPTVTGEKPKRNISPALRKARSEAVKARWAAKRAGGTTRL